MSRNPPEPVVVATAPHTDVDAHEIEDMAAAGWLWMAQELPSFAVRMITLLLPAVANAKQVVGDGHARSSKPVRSRPAAGVRVCHCSPPSVVTRTTALVPPPAKPATMQVCPLHASVWKMIPPPPGEFPSKLAGVGTTLQDLPPLVELAKDVSAWSISFGP